MRVKGHQLTEVQVKRVSLVDRGAIRAPFKIMKRDASVTEGANMSKFSLKGLFKSTAVAAAPAVIAIVAAKSADQAALKARVEKAGFSVADAVEGDDVVIYRQPGAPDEVEGIVLKFDEDCAAVISGVRKEFAPWNVESPTFGDLMSVQGVYPTMSVAMEVLTSKVWSAIYDAKTPDEASTGITKAFDDAKQFVSAYAQDLPVAAFKLDQFVEKADSATGVAAPEETTNAHGAPKKPKKEKVPAGGTGVAAPEDATNKEGEAPAAAKKGAGPLDTAAVKSDRDEPKELTKAEQALELAKAAEIEASKASAKATEDAADGGKDDAEENADGVIQDPSKKKKPAAKAEGDSEVADLLKGLVASVKEIADVQTSLVENVEDLTGRVAKAEAGVSKAETASTQLKVALKSTLPGVVAAADRSEKPAAKTEAYTGGLIDTAFDRSGLD